MTQSKNLFLYYKNKVETSVNTDGIDIDFTSATANGSFNSVDLIDNSINNNNISKLSFLIGRLFVYNRKMQKKIIKKEEMPNIGITICCEGRGHMTQFMNMYNFLDETQKKKIKFILLPKNAYEPIPNYFIEFCNDNMIEISWIYGCFHSFNNNKVNYICLVIKS